MHIRIRTRFPVSLFLLVCMVSLVWGHGRLLDPPSRASAWRFGWGTPVDYNDNEGFCGGLHHQWATNGGKCGICGDPWEESPRQHEAGGRYATGTIVKSYVEGQVITVTVEITSNHKGHFEFRICPNNNYKVEATQTCLNDNPLYLADGSGFKYQIPTWNGKHNVTLKLPEGLVCTQCVLQWRYVAGNNWGICDDGSGALGCGPQEEFRACADVAINGSQGVTTTTGSPTSTESSVVTNSPSTPPTSSSTPQAPSTPATSSSTPQATSTPATSSSKPRATSIPATSSSTPQAPSTTATSSSTPQATSIPATSSSTPQAPSTTATTIKCAAVGIWASVAGMNDWCQTNCNHVPKFCPQSHCRCS